MQTVTRGGTTTIKTHEHERTSFNLSEQQANAPPQGNSDASTRIRGQQAFELTDSIEQGGGQTVEA